MGIRTISRRVQRAADRLNDRTQKSADELAAEQRAEAEKPRVSAEDQVKRVAAAGLAQRATAAPLMLRAQSIDAEKFGLGEEGLAQRAAERKSLFQEQQGQLQARQGTTQRSMQESMQRRLGAQGLRGTGTAERLAQVAERQFGRGAAQQAAGLRLGQGQQELAAREQERRAIQQVTQFGEQAKLQASELATRLQAQGQSQEQARIFAENQLGQQQAFQEHVVLKMQNDQFKERMRVAMDQFDQNMKQRIREFDLDEEVTRFNMALSEAEANKGGMFDRLASMDPTQFWSQHPLLTGDTGGIGGFRGNSPTDTILKRTVARPGELFKTGTGGGGFSPILGGI